MKNSEKVKIGRLLTSFIKQIAQEKIVQENFDDHTAKEKAITKAEALCRIVWRDALGWTEITSDGKRKEHRPDKTMIQLIYDRMEGKVGSIDDRRKKDADIPDRVSEVAKARVNRISDGQEE